MTVCEPVQALTGKPFRNIDQRLRTLTKRRRDDIAGEGTGQELSSSELTNALDAWIEILEIVGEKDRQKKLVSSRLKAERA